MIRYRLRCGADHEFEAWFGSSTAYETEETAGRLSCPICQRTDIERALMAPQVRTRRTPRSRDNEAETSQAAVATTSSVAGSMPVQAGNASPELRKLLNEMRTLRDKILSQSEYVGPNLATEARNIHFNDAPERPIHGEATPEEVRGLEDDGIQVLPIPSLPDDLN